MLKLYARSSKAYCHRRAYFYQPASESHDACQMQPADSKAEVELEADEGVDNSHEADSSTTSQEDSGEDSPQDPGLVACLRHNCCNELDRLYSLYLNKVESVKATAKHREQVYEQHIGILRQALSSKHEEGETPKRDLVDMKRQVA